MKRRVSIVLMVLLVFSLLSVTGVSAAAEEPVQFVLDGVSYLDNQTKLEVRGHYVNVGTRPVLDVIEMPIEIYDGTTLVVKGVYKKEIAGAIGINVGDIEKVSFTMASPVQWLKLTDVKCVASVVHNLGDPAKLPEGKKVYYKGSLIEYDVKPAVINGRLMVPARATFEKMGAIVAWNADAQSITVTKGQQTVILFIGNSLMSANGKQIKLDAPAQIIDGRTLVPLRAISSALGDKILYGSQSEVAAIFSAE